MSALPQGPQNLITTALRTSRNLPSAVTNILPQSFWMNELLLGSAGLLPWLWDIDVAEIRSKANAACPGGPRFEWNWELLVRQLSLGVDAGSLPEYGGRIFPDSIKAWTYSGYDDELLHVPTGLHNRRRIWQLIEEMFVGDALPVTIGRGMWDDGTPDIKNCVRLYWLPSGKKRDVPVRLPSMDPHLFEVRIGGKICRNVLYKFRRTVSDGGDMQDWMWWLETREHLKQVGYPIGEVAELQERISLY